MGNHQIPRITFIAALALVASACSGASSEPADSTGAVGSTRVTTATEATDPTTAPVALPARLTLVTGRWNTDWSKRTIDLEELQIGIQAADPRDRIPPLDDPTFESVTDASLWLQDREPGVFAEIDGVARFYPLQILTLHEIVNDEIAGVPVAVTYCPLCNTAVVFDRRLEGETHRLGVSGLLRNSDLVMWDDVTESLFQQITGEGIVGAHAGRSLVVVPSSLVRFADFREARPGGEVLSQDTGFAFPYGVNPYEGYSGSASPFLFDGEIDPRYPALERVVGVTIGNESKAYPFPEISPIGAVNDSIGAQPIVVLWGAADTADALDDSFIASGRAVGVGVAYDPVVDGRRLTFERVSDTTFRDLETRSIWTILGEATTGPLAGTSLVTLPHRNEFWFAWSAFFPDAPVYEA